ncbi:MAG TPA: hypothetical protein VGB37_05280 [Candidatus Lokiarchaeia archaeon]
MMQTLWNNKTFQKIIDIIRILLFVVAVIILIVLLTNINEIKTLTYDVCRLCQEKTGAICFIK